MSAPPPVLNRSSGVLLVNRSTLFELALKGRYGSPQVRTHTCPGLPHHDLADYVPPTVYRASCYIAAARSMIFRRDGATFACVKRDQAPPAFRQNQFCPLNWRHFAHFTIYQGESICLCSANATLSRESVFRYRKLTKGTEQ